MPALSRLAKTLRGLASLVRNPWLLNHVLAADEASWQKRSLRHTSRWQIGQNGLPMAALAPLLPAAGEIVKPFAFREGGSLPTDLALLRALARQISNCRYFEIGTWRGESAANVAEVAATVHTLNLSAAEMQALGLSERYANLHGYFSRPLPNVTHLKGNSATFLMRELGHFDLVFIDGDHRYEAVRTDTQRVFEHLVGPGTTVVWHDASRQPGQPRWEVIAGILDGIPATATGQLVQIENTLCAVYSPRPLLTYLPEPLADPVPAYQVTVQALS